MSKKGYSRPGLFGSINHYDANGKKVGESRSGFFSGMNDYDANGKKIGHSFPFFFGGMNHYDMLWSSIFVTLMANKIGGLQFGIYRNCQISSRVFHTAVAALPLTKANRSYFE